jgi:hypothetical protein
MYPHIFVDLLLFFGLHLKKAVVRIIGFKSESADVALAAAWSSGIVSACYRGDWSYGS